MWPNRLLLNLGIHIVETTPLVPYPRYAKVMGHRGGASHSKQKCPTQPQLMHIVSSRDLGRLPRGVSSGATNSEAPVGTGHATTPGAFSFLCFFFFFA